MEIFNVKDVAELLSVNEETVRRWIREDKLKAERGSGRQGSKVSSEYLREFLAKNKNLTTTLAASTLGIAAVTSTIASAIGMSWLSVLKSKEKDKKEIKVELLEKELELENIAMQLKTEIARKQNELELVENQISKLNRIIEEIE